MTSLLCKPPVLPIDSLKAEFDAAIGVADLVVQSDTGSGKSTRIPIWAASLGMRVLMIEPRRVACVALADYLGGESQRQDHGLAVGYAIRFDCQVDDTTRLAVVTPGIALNWFAENQLQDFDLVIIDEFHERRWDTDLLLSLLKCQGLHRLLVMSATMDGHRLRDYLGPEAKLLSVSGQRYQVETSYLATCASQLPDSRDLAGRIKLAVELALSKMTVAGDILVFLPGKGEINQCRQLLAALDIACLTLHGGSDLTEQRQVMASTGNTRVILATNVAETSLTIPGVVCVIDAGLERRTHQRNGRTVLSLGRISKASAAQRLGRAGRVADGLCIRLWGEHAVLVASSSPELQREELTEPMLAAAACGYKLAQLPWVDTLLPRSVAEASQKLQTMGALDAGGMITDHGRRLYPLPLDTQFAHLISAMKDDECKAMMVDLAACLSVGGRLWQSPRTEDDLLALSAWEPLGCDAMALLRLIRQGVPDFLAVDPLLVNEARVLALQIRRAVDLPERDLSLPDFDTRLRWLSQVIAALPELAYVQRLSRDNAYGNGHSEVQVSREGRFALFHESRKTQAAVVFDQFSLPGRGVKQTINMATCMAPVSWSLLAELGLGEEQVASQQPDPQQGCLIERVYAGRVIHTAYRAVTGEQALDAAVQAILTGELMPGVAARLADDLAAFALWRSLPDSSRQQYLCGVADDSHLQELEREVEPCLRRLLNVLGVSELDDLALIDDTDLVIEGIPEWCRSAFDAAFPRTLTLAELKLGVNYDARSKRVELVYESGVRKTDPKRWELPTWPGWRVQYRKASRVVEIR
ncbi:helicase-related protein [Shewanella sp. GXUN23E]|uniref:helicase-related protein n=1 Tax=Shewanella sp. GXUN23E TaxID=3422498 RepID=UPI003D7F03C8